MNHLGDAYVANRAFSGTASATKIQNDFCQDRNHNGVIDTSHDGGEVLDWTAEGPDDECIVWNTEAGAVGNLGRSIAAQTRQELDGGTHEYVWLGLYNARKYVEIDGETGEVTGEEAQFSSLTPYGAAIDADGNLWSASLGSYLGRFDTNNPRGRRRNLHHLQLRNHRRRERTRMAQRQRHPPLPPRRWRV